MSIHAEGTGLIRYCVGDLEVMLDYEGLTVTVSRGVIAPGGIARTEELGNGILLDRDANGIPVSVELIAGEAQLA